MRKNFAVIFTTTGIIVTLSMFMNIVGCIESQIDTTQNNTHVISAFVG